MATTVPAPRHSAAAWAEALGRLREQGRVRLDDVETTALAGALDGVVAESVELFGSRTEPFGRGGDIDLLILSSGPRLETARRVSSRFFMGCEERIDVVVLDPKTLTAAEDAFVRSLRRVRIA